MDNGLKHLSYLYERTQKGDRLYNEDINFILSLEQNLSIAHEQINYIRERLLND